MTSPALLATVIGSLRCPSCGGELDAGGARVRCRGCGNDYSAADEIFDLALVRDPQEAHYELHVDEKWEAERPHSAPRFHQWILEWKLSAGLETVRSRDQPSVLNVCAGSGMDAELLANGGAEVALLDISRAALLRARERLCRAGFDFVGIRGDVTQLPVADRAFDFVFVHDGLHHLEDPRSAVLEMARAAREGIVILEPAKGTLTSIATKLGLADSVEEAGNVVRRFSPDELRRWSREAGLPHISVSRRFILQHHYPTRAEAVWSVRALAPVGRAVYRGLGRTLGPVGNKLAFVATRR